MYQETDIVQNLLIVLQQWKVFPPRKSLETLAQIKSLPSISLLLFRSPYYIGRQLALVTGKSNLKRVQSWQKLLDSTEQQFMRQCSPSKWRRLNINPTMEYSIAPAVRNQSHVYFQSFVKCCHFSSSEDTDKRRERVIPPLGKKKNHISFEIWLWNA